jgi:hypothetical protein
VYGLHLVLQSKLPDDGVIVLARLSDGTPAQLERVGDIAEKVRAIASAKDGASPWAQIDTIVVADEWNRGEVLAALSAIEREQRRRPDVRVVIPSTDATR